MLEYSAVLGGGLTRWMEDAYYLVASISNSAYFWPTIAAAVVAIVVVARLLSPR